MTTLTDRPATALLVVDVQVGVVAQAVDRDGVVANIATPRRQGPRRRRLRRLGPAHQRRAPDGQPAVGVRR
jgi:hypothetical protein